MDDNAVEVIRRLCDAIDQMLEVEVGIPAWGAHYASHNGESVAATRDRIHRHARDQVEIARQLVQPSKRVRPLGG